MKIFSVFLVLMMSCAQDKHGYNKANIHMHKQPHESLIASFDDPQRDRWQKPLKVIELIGQLKGKQIIDIGSGSGYFTKYFLKEGAIVTATDVDPKFLEHVQKEFPQKKYPNLSFQLIEYNDPKMELKFFDVAFISNTYHHIDRRVDYLKKVYSGLQFGGKIVILDFKTDGREEIGPPLKLRIPLSKVVEELTLAGFDHIQVFNREFENQYMIMGKRTGP